MATKNCRRAFALLLLFAADIERAWPQAADNVAVASFRLRGGFDANPTLLESGRSAAFAGFDAAFAAGTLVEGVKAGMVGEASRTQYFSGEIEPSEHYKTALEIANIEDGDFSFRSTSTVEGTRNYQLHAFDAAQRVRFQWNGGALRPFVTGEFRYATLNETNVIFPDFLPEDQRYLRSTAIPGVSYKQDDLELGASVNFSTTRYMEPFDTFGFRRDNERAQPFVFARFDTDRLSVFASISKLYGDWHDVDFTDVSEMLFDVSAATKTEPVSLELSVRRFASETTFPVSPLAIVTAYAAKLSWQMDEKNALAAFTNDVTTEYLDSPFVSRTLSYGVAFDRKLADDLTFGIEVSRAHAIPLVGEDVTATAAFLSIGKTFGAGDPQRQAAALPPVELGSRPSLRKR